MFSNIHTAKEKSMKFKAINKNREFIKGYKRGASFVSPLVVTYVLKNRCGHMRIGITASKKVGGAVQRNRARRIIREAVRSLNLDMSKNYDIIFVARSRTVHSKTQHLIPMIKLHMEKAGVLNA
ncbi:MAG: ribonuclease P protein component [Oscillospiraceae bacterium]